MTSAAGEPAYADLGFRIPSAFLGERRRQIESEGWSAQHDDHHADGSLLQAAMQYYRHALGLPMPTRRRVFTLTRQVLIPLQWPWDDRWWKPKTAHRDLERAGALCLAEIDRLRREDASHPVDVVALVLRDIVLAYRQLPDPVPS